MIYIRIIEQSGTPRKENWIQRLIIFLVGLIIPKANPDFEKKIDLVAFWLIEFDDQDPIPAREIGLDQSENVILKMPYKKNYGYWTDNNMTLADFQNAFKTEFISKDYFEKKWNSAFADS